MLPFVLASLALILAGCAAPRDDSKGSPAAAADTPARPDAAPRADTPIDGSALRADVALLRDEYTALHPGLYRYNTPAQIDALFAQLAASLGQGATLRDAYRQLALFAARIECGHTYLNPYNQEEPVQRALFGGPRLPLRFRWLDGRMIALESLAPGVPIAPGTEVLSIDGRPAPELLAELLPFGRADGGNQAKRIANLERRGLDRFEPFDIALSLLHPKTAAEFVLALRAPDGAARTVRLPALTGLPAEPPDDPAAGALWTLRFLDATTAYLKMPTWETWHTKWDWQAQVKHDFDELEARGARALIVDLRGNEGGSDVGDALLAHFLDAPLPEESLQRWTRYRAVPEALRPPLHTWDKSFFDWGAGALPMDNGFFRLTRYDDDARGDVLQPALPRSRARLVVLVDGTNSSATFQFAQLVQRHHLGALVGEPTGGNQRGINGGAFFFLSLPGSHLELDLPLIGRFPADGHPERLPDAGLQPDVLAAPTAESIAAGRDVGLEEARRLVSGPAGAR